MNGWRRYVNECINIYEWTTEVCEWMYKYIWMDDGGKWMDDGGMWMNVYTWMDDGDMWMNVCIWMDDGGMWMYV